MRENEEWVEQKKKAESKLYLLETNTPTDRGKQTESDAPEPVNMVLNNWLQFVQQRLVLVQIG